MACSILDSSRRCRSELPNRRRTASTSPRRHRSRPPCRADRGSATDMPGAGSPTIDARRRRGGHGPRFLGRFGIRGKLNILLLFALATVLLVSMPFVAGQVGNARSAGDTANSAQDARELGGLIWELQRERLVTAAYLAAPNAASTDLAEQQRKVDSTADEVQTALGPSASDELTASLVRLGSLKEPRQSALLRGISPDRRGPHLPRGHRRPDRRVTARPAGYRRRRGHQATRRARCIAAGQRVQRSSARWR